MFSGAMIRALLASAKTQTRGTPRAGSIPAAPLTHTRPRAQEMKMTPLPTPESLSAILVRPRPHARGPRVPLSTLARVPVVELRKIYGTSVAYRLTGLTGGMVSTRAVLSRAGAAQGLETVHGAARRRGVSPCSLARWLQDAGAIEPLGRVGVPGMVAGGSWHRLPSEVIDRVIAERPAEVGGRARERHERHVAATTCACGGPKAHGAGQCLPCDRRSRRTLSAETARALYLSDNPYRMGASLGLGAGVVQGIVNRQTYRDVTEGLTPGRVAA